jgi:UDPglucose--hexose-1-phosphate uridylyltransferase
MTKLYNIMSELRRDPISGRWVIIASERGKRPSDFHTHSSPKEGGFCAFCEGNEGSTPPEITALRPDGSQPDTPGWRIRVIPNKFPALRMEGELNRESDTFFEKMNGIGTHELIIESPEHGHKLSNMPRDSVVEVLRTFQQRIRYLKNDMRIKYVLIFKNEGVEAGASLQHTHSQLIALPIVPELVEEELEHTRNYYKEKGECMICRIIKEEKAEGSRVISENDDFISLAPFAPRSPFETLILPKSHEPDFMVTESLDNLADILQLTLKQIEKVLGSPPYNMMIHTLPSGDEGKNFYHWHIEIKPKLTKTAGFEWGSGFFINPMPPEEAAGSMREADI